MFINKSYINMAIALLLSTKISLYDLYGLGYEIRLCGGSQVDEKTVFRE